MRALFLLLKFKFPLKDFLRLTVSKGFIIVIPNNKKERIRVQFTVIWLDMNY